MHHEALASFEKVAVVDGFQPLRNRGNPCLPTSFSPSQASPRRSSSPWLCDAASVLEPPLSAPTRQPDGIVHEGRQRRRTEARHEGLVAHARNGLLEDEVLDKAFSQAKKAMTESMIPTVCSVSESK